MISSDAAFVAAHRLVAEVAAGRPVALVDGASITLAAPLDGGPILSGELAISAARAAWLKLGDAPIIFAAGTEERARLWAIATEPVVADLPPQRAGGCTAAAAVELAKLAERLPAMTLRPVSSVPVGTLSADAHDVMALRRVIAGTFGAVATARVPLAAGALSNVTAFRNAVGGIISAVTVGPIADGALVRVHSQCVTGDIFGSKKCDCGPQLRMALESVAFGGGVLVYTAQEGRGIGLVNKLRAYSLQERGLDTVDANATLGFHDDERDYAAAAAVLSHLGLTRVRLMTNNPSKTAGLEGFGIAVEPVPLVSAPTSENAGYLATKRRRSGHTL